MEREPWDVIVVGAGAAGLAAARQLRERGVRALVVEARGRFGGRIFPFREGSDPVLELGAEWVHGQPASLLAIAARANESVLSLHLHQLCWEGGGLRPCGDRMRRALRRLREPLDEDISVAERARREGWLPDEWEAAVRFVEGYDAADPERISALACSTEGVANHRAFRFARGYGPLCDHLAEGLDIRLHTVVEEVRWRPGEVELRTSEGTIAGRAVIVTVPLGVLQAPPSEKGSIRFTPELPEKARAADVLQMGSARKLLIRFHEAPRLPSPAFVHVPEFSVPLWWSSSFAPSALWVGWAGGSAARRLGNDPTEAAFSTLSKILSMPRREVEARVADIRWWDWDADPFSRGAYAYMTVGGHRAQDELAEPVAHTLFFAGEATSRDDIGTVQGAVESGWRAAGEVLVARKLLGTPQIRPRRSAAGPIDRAGADAGGDRPGSVPTP